MDAVIDRREPRASEGGVPARRAVTRWAWRLFRREWRQQFLILALITVAVAATIIGSAVAVNTPPPKNAGFGSAEYSATFASFGTKAQSFVAKIDHVGTSQLIENETLTIPGTIGTYQIRSQDPHGRYGGPMLSLVSGRYPTNATQVAVTSLVATDFRLSVGDNSHFGGVTRRVVGIVENPQSLTDEFALVVPGQVKSPTNVTVLFDAPSASLRTIHSKGVQIDSPASVAQSNPLNPETISLAALVLGMLLIALVSIGGFTVLAQRRMRSIGMLESIGATDRHVRRVISANGTIVGLAGAVLGFVLGLVAWLAYRPHLELSAHHDIATLALPWLVVIAAMILAVLAAYFSSSRPARAVTRVPIVVALSGRPAPARQIHRSAVPGMVLLVASFLLLGYSGGTKSGNGSGGTPELLLGLLLLVPGLILLAPFLLSLTGRLSRRAPIATRLALRDLARYRARSGSALSAISIGVLVAVIVILAAASRFANVLDYAGPNLASTQIVLHTANPGAGHQIVRRNSHGKLVVVKNAPTETATPSELNSSASTIVKDLGAQLIALESPSAQLVGTQGGRNWSGQIYVATPQLLRAYGITKSEVNPDADILSSRPGLAGVSGLAFTYATGNKAAGAPGSAATSPQTCDAAHGCMEHPVIQYIAALPAGTSAPNTVITEHAVKEFHISASTQDWLVQGATPFTAVQISNAQLTASTAQLSVESRNDIPTSASITSTATLFGILIALGVLGMSVGLVRSETASDLRTLAAAGASTYTRRTLTAVTAGALGFLGALLGAAGGYIGMIGWLRSNSLNGGISALSDVPIGDLLLILVGMPAFAAMVGWLFAGREQSGMSRQPIN